MLASVPGAQHYPRQQGWGSGHFECAIGVSLLSKSTVRVSW